MIGEEGVWIMLLFTREPYAHAYTMLHCCKTASIICIYMYLLSKDQDDLQIINSIIIL